MNASMLSPAAAEVLLENLLAAFESECVARTRYPVFAEEADREGYGGIASLFRAAARAEETHAGNHAFVLRELGCNPEPKIEVPVAKSTRENLEVALAAERHEHDVLYPAVLARARAEHYEPAEKTVFLAKEVEAEHVRLFTAALADLEDFRGPNVTYYVCPICGFMAQTLESSDCAICDGLVEEFVEVR